ncbi:hypothetical protein [Azovibrio restrictus]|uniref:hypothetical protein n=1 Tax=Azovibrio restrictus TaxID=146938 RepID=UPI0026F181A6|nr:hypothetical protein [Azovibrio restrictus]MDD3481312.1 hypothetical protein [Azovibrio restrictus]
MTANVIQMAISKNLSFPLCWALCWGFKGVLHATSFSRCGWQGQCQGHGGASGGRGANAAVSAYWIVEVLDVFQAPMGFKAHAMFRPMPDAVGFLRGVMNVGFEVDFRAENIDVDQQNQI